jgi:uncharacterized repeat protein (TIGR01451 family)
VFLTITVAYAAGTPAGTVISNYATGEYKDANGNSMTSVTSNTVTTTVTQVGGADVTASSGTAIVESGESVSIPVTLTNTGNGPDTFDLSKIEEEIGGGDNTVEIYYDANGNGVVDAGETTVTATDAMAADSAYNIIIVVTNNSGDDGSSVTIELAGTSQFDTNVSDTANVEVTLSAPELVVTITVDNDSPQPGDVVTVTITGTNNGSATAEDLVFSGAIPTDMTYVPGSLKITTSARTDADDADSSDYNVTTAGSVTLGYGDIASSGSGYATFQVTLDAGVPAGTVITPIGSADFTPNGDPIIGTGGEMTVSQAYAVTVGANDSTNADPGDVVVYAVTVTNSGNGSDSFGLSTSDDSTWTWTIYKDVNENGAYDSGTDTEITNTGTLGQDSILYVLVRATVPAGEEDMAVNAMTLTATSVGGGSESDVGVYTVTVTAPALSLTKTVSPTGPQPPDTELTYTVIISNSGSGTASTIVISDAVPTNTTYVAGSMTVGGASKTDASDADGATLSGNSAVFEVSTLSAGGSETVTFKVTID